MCEPVGRLDMLSRPVPSRLFSETLTDQHMLGFSIAATELMAERARATVSLMRSLPEEFHDYKVTALAKCGFDRATAAGQEHIWLEVHDERDGMIDGTLVNEPFDLPRSAPGNAPARAN